MIKAIFFDVDGTLISHQSGTIPQSTRDALTELRNKGIKTFLATGRHMLEIQQQPVNDIYFDGYATLNGQLCYDSDRSLFYGVPIESGDCKKLLYLFAQRKTPIMIVEKDNMYINFVNDGVCCAQQAISTPIPPIGDYTREDIYQFIVYAAKDGEKEIVDQISECQTSRWNEYAIDIIPKNGGKVSGILQFLKHYGIDQNEIMAFGDGENDIDMLKFASCGIAMGNADGNVKKNADYVTDAVDANGITNALKRFEII